MASADGYQLMADGSGLDRQAGESGGPHMSTDEGAGSGIALLAFLVGAMAGAAVALLYAPATGRETRELLGEKAREGREKAAALAEKGRQAINESRETV